MEAKKEVSFAPVPSSFLPSSPFWGARGEAAATTGSDQVTHGLGGTEEQASTAWSRTGQKSIPPSAAKGVGVGSGVGVPWSGVKAALSLGKLGLLTGYGDLEGGLAFPQLLGGECRRAWPPSGVGTEKASSSEPPRHYLELRLTLPPISPRP